MVSGRRTEQTLASRRFVFVSHLLGRREYVRRVEEEEIDFPGVRFAERSQQIALHRLDGVAHAVRVRGGARRRHSVRVDVGGETPARGGRVVGEERGGGDDVSRAAAHLDDDAGRGVFEAGVPLGREGVHEQEAVLR